MVDFFVGGAGAVLALANLSNQESHANAFCWDLGLKFVCNLPQDLHGTMIKALPGKLVLQFASTESSPFFLKLQSIQISSLKYLQSPCNVLVTTLQCLEFVTDSRLLSLGLVATLCFDCYLDEFLVCGLSSRQAHLKHT